MNRREALSSVALLLGGTIIGAEMFLSGCTNPDKIGTAGLQFSPDDISFLDEVGETIIPATRPAKIILRITFSLLVERGISASPTRAVSRLNEVMGAPV